MTPPNNHPQPICTVNNRRSFFKSLALLASGAAVAPGIFVPKFEPVRWKVTPSYTFDPPNYFGKWRWVLYEPGIDGMWHKTEEIPAPIQGSASWPMNANPSCLWSCAKPNEMVADKLFLPDREVSFIFHVRDPVTPTQT